MKLRESATGHRTKAVIFDLDSWLATAPRAGVLSTHPGKALLQVPAFQKRLVGRPNDGAPKVVAILVAPFTGRFTLRIKPIRPIALVTVVFGIARTELLRPPGFEEESRLMWIRRVNIETGAAENQLSWQDLEDIRSATRSFETVATDNSSWRPTPHRTESRWC